MCALLDSVINTISAANTGPQICINTTSSTLSELNVKTVHAVTTIPDDTLLILRSVTPCGVTM